MTTEQDPKSYLRWFEDLKANDVPVVGGKNASLGELIVSLKAQGVHVPGGFATTSDAYWEFLEATGCKVRIAEHLKRLNDGSQSLEKTGKAIRRLIRQTPFPPAFAQAIRKAYAELSQRYGKEEVDVAVRSSATAEDLPSASFAGQQESYLNIAGPDEVLEACQNCMASLFTDRAISYREEKGFQHLKVALSVGIQKMVRSDKASSGVMFTLDTETGFPDVVVINAAWGLGENVVQGMVNPDEYVVFKPLLETPNLCPILEKRLGDKERTMIYARGGRETTRNVETPKRQRDRLVLSDEDILQLARWAVAIEKHYGRPMDIEWAKDGESGELFILQARPETVQSQRQAATLKQYRLKEKGRCRLQGLAIGQAIASGKAQVIRSVDRMNEFEEGSILVTGMTDPDWVPIMKKAAGIVTDHGGRTSHAAIVSRELGVPAIVGTGQATSELKDGEEITMSCAEGDTGYVYEGRLEFESQDLELDKVPETKTRIMINIASPAAAFRWWRLPCQGIGLARMEFIINNLIKIHPMALVHFDQLVDHAAKREIAQLTRGFEDKTEYFVEHLSRGIAKIAASQYPDPVIVRMSDFKTNEYADLIGGRQFEPREDNPMLGFRGASRYYHERYRDGFTLECKAIRRVRERIGLTNVRIMIPFCRTLDEADRVLEALAERGLVRGQHGLEILVMCEIPSNVILAAEFAKRFDGFSIGTNDLTQLVLGVDRDSQLLSQQFNERDEAVKQLVRQLIQTAHQSHCKVGICGQAPSDYPEFAAFLVQAGIDSMSLNPDSVITVKERVAREEAKLTE